MAAKDFGIDVKNSLLVGDNDFDIIAGNAAGCRTIMVNGNIGIKEAEKKLREIIVSGALEVQNGNIR